MKVAHGNDGRPSAVAEAMMIMTDGRRERRESGRNDEKRALAHFRRGRKRRKKCSARFLLATAPRARAAQCKTDRGAQLSARGVCDHGGNYARTVTQFGSLLTRVPAVWPRV